jgi:phosphoglycolate phosphatase
MCVGFGVYIFDLDGTLIDTRRDITNSVNDMLTHFGLEPKTVVEVTSFVGDGIKKLVERCVDGRKIDAEKAVAVFESAYSSRLLETTKTYPGVFELLNSIRDKYKAILTNKALRYSKAITDGLGLTPHFNLIAGGDTFEKKKPSPVGIEHILHRAGREKHEALMIGDGKNDILTAKKAGIASVFVAYGFSGENALMDVQPDFVIAEPLELLNIKSRD